MPKSKAIAVHPELKKIVKNMRDVFGDPTKKDTYRVGRKDWHVTRWELSHGAAILYRNGKNGRYIQELRIERYSSSKGVAVTPQRDETFYINANNHLAFEIMSYPGREVNNKPRNILFSGEITKKKQGFLIGGKELVGDCRYFRKVRDELTSGSYDDTLAENLSVGPKPAIPKGYYFSVFLNKAMPADTASPAFG